MFYVLLFLKASNDNILVKIIVDRLLVNFYFIITFCIRSYLCNFMTKRLYLSVIFLEVMT